MKVIEANLYNYDKAKGYIPLDKNNIPLFNTKKDYRLCINGLLDLMGLENVTQQCFVKHFVNANPNDPLNAYGLGEKVRKDIKYNKNTNKVKWLNKNYIFLKIEDESKLTWYNVMRTLKVKKIHKPFFITNYNLNKTNYTRFVKFKLLAVPVSNLDSDILIHKLTYLFKNNVKVLSEFTYPFNFNMAITDAFSNELLTLEKVIDYAQNHQSINIMNVVDNISTHKSIFFRNSPCYENNKEEWIYVEDDINWGLDWGDPKIVEWYKTLDPKLIEERNKLSSLKFRYKKSWIINSRDEFKDKLYTIIPNLINRRYSNLDLSSSQNISREQCWLIIKWYLVKFSHNRTYWDLNNNARSQLNAILNQFNYVYDWCLNNQKDLSLKQQRHISNANKLTNVESMHIDMFITNKVFNLTNPYKKESCQKNYKLFLSRFIKEVFGKIKFESDLNNKDYNHNKWIKFENKLDKHISQVHISNKEFNLIIDELKLVYEDFNITPSSNLKYKILKAIGLEIDEEYDFELYGKSIVNSKSYLKNILNKLVDNLSYKLSNNFIIIYVKKLSEMIEEVVSNSIKCCEFDVNKDPPNMSLT